MQPSVQENLAAFWQSPLLFQLKSGKVSDPEGELQTKSSFHTAPGELGSKRRLWQDLVSYKTPTKGLLRLLLEPLGTAAPGSAQPWLLSVLGLTTLWLLHSALAWMKQEKPLLWLCKARVCAFSFLLRTAPFLFAQTKPMFFLARLYLERLGMCHPLQRGTGQQPELL